MYLLYANGNRFHHEPQVLGLRRKGAKAWAKQEDKRELAAIAAACPGATGAGVGVLTSVDDDLPLFDDEDRQLKRYMPKSYSSLGDYQICR